ncbi:protein FLOURY 1-like [Salvia divinorum]|uniref:Protein FLOURY 1-like n=1 Tax=Salvia divinorum TaxID=28513 RepID=A0ABD1GJP9_SALDI
MCEIWALFLLLGFGLKSLSSPTKRSRVSISEEVIDAKLKRKSVRRYDFVLERGGRCGSEKIVEDGAAESGCSCCGGGERSATATEEAMAMIQRRQREKNSIAMGDTISTVDCVRPETSTMRR